MSTGLNRALQVRTADRLRTDLSRDEAFGLPIMAELPETDRRELCEVGGGRLAAVAVCIEGWTASAMELHVRHQDGHRALMVRAVARLIEEHVRRTDLLGWLSGETLVVLAPGLDAFGARSLGTRLHGLLNERQVEIGGKPLDLRVSVGSACRSHASRSGWTIGSLGAEAELQARQPAAVATVA